MWVHLSTEGLALLQIIVASVLPTLVAVLNDSRASAAVKTWTLIVLTVVADLLTSLLATPDFEIKQVLISFFGMLFAAIAAHKGVSSNLGLSGAGSAPAQKGLSIGKPIVT